MSYFNYLDRALNRDYKRWRKAPGPHGVAVPGHLYDLDARKDTKHKFDRWYKRPDAAMRLYWRTHPQYGRVNNSNFKYWPELIKV